jgi:hypothetical protein
MKYLIITGIFALGISLGYVVGTQQTPEESTPVVMNQEDTGQAEIMEQDSEHDREKPAAESTLDSMEATLDTTIDYSAEDSIMLVEYSMIDSMNDEDLSISREKLIRGVRLPIIYLAQTELKDSAIKESLGIEEVQAKTMFVEFWESPLNFEGYKLSKKKLIVYGMSPQLDYKLYKRENDYYFAFQNVYYKMKETQDFLPFSEVSKSEVFND